MKSITIIIYFCALWLTVVSDGVERKKIVKLLNRMAEKSESIYGILKPSENGCLGAHDLSLIYKGVLIPENMTVTMKFTKGWWGKHEYNIYTYLNAIDDSRVEAYGIPSIHYFGLWNNYYIMAMKLFDLEFQQYYHAKKFNDIDLLILFREIVRITKYIHSRGVFHDNLQFVFMMFGKHQGFIYDFTVANSFPHHTLQDKLCAARKDWKEIFYEIWKLLKIKKPRWNWPRCSDKSTDNVLRMKYFEKLAASVINDSETNESHESSGLREVFIKFAKRAFGDDKICTTSFYDPLYQAIVEKIEKYAKKQQKPAIPSWLSSDEDKQNAITAMGTIPPISNIRDPFGSDDIEYKEVNYTLFHERYREIYIEYNREQESLMRESERSDPGNTSFDVCNCFKQ